MKILKKHAMATAKFAKIFFDHGYYPADEMEEVLLGKVLGFAAYHKVIQTGDTKDWRGAGEITVDVKARLDITDDEASAILDMYNEVEADPQVEEPIKFMQSTLSYFLKEFN